MGKEILEKMKVDGLDLGKRIELILKEEVHFNNETTTIPTYHLAREGLESHTSKRRFLGYVAIISEKSIDIVPGWDDNKNKLAEQGYIGGVRIDLDAIGNYKIYD